MNNDASKQSLSHRKPGSGRRGGGLRGGAACLGVVALLVLGGAGSLSLSDVRRGAPYPDFQEAGPSVAPTIDYPDSFGFRSEYLSRFLINQYTVRPGDTLYKVFQRFGLPTECLDEALTTCEVLCRLNRLRPGDHLAIHARRSDGEVVKMVHGPATGGDPRVFRRDFDSNRWTCQRLESETITISRTVRGVITDNLYDSCLRAGLPPPLVTGLSDLFAYDIDFNTDLRKGDAFAVFFEQEVRDGKRVSAGPILAAHMEVNRRSHDAYYFRPPQGEQGEGRYYDARGQSLRKSFLKAPLQYSRISSAFTHKRFHPILKIYRPHLGIDYAAPTGTPVSALGAGVVTYLGAKGGYGKFVEITHNETFKTTYGHLSRYGSGLRTGSRVGQGQVIGYVGSTGLATGPHLDFRFYKNGDPIDFLKTNFPYAQTIPDSLRGNFDRKLRQYRAALQGDTRIALRERPSLHTRE